MRTTIIALATVAVLVGCSHTPVPNTEYAAAEHTVGRAQESGAPSVPDARLHLELAQEDLATAKTLMLTDDDDKRSRAASLIARSQNEAELAVALAREARAHNDAARAQQSLNMGQAPPGVANPSTPGAGTTTTTGADVSKKPGGAQ